MINLRFFYIISITLALIVPGQIAYATAPELHLAAKKVADDGETTGSETSLKAHDIRQKLLTAVRGKNADNLKKLLSESPKYTAGEYQNGKTLLRIAIKESTAQIVKLLLENDTSDINLQDESGFTPLMAAAVWKKTDVVKHLLDHGADPNIRDNMGNTALFRTIFTKNNEALRMLILNGANVDIPNNSGSTPRMMLENTKQGLIMKQALQDRK